MVDRLTLLYGPYIAPKVRKGDWLTCELRGSVQVGGYTSALIPWPRQLKAGRPCLIVTTELARAVRAESEIAIAHHWGVGITTIWAWRRALSVPQVNDGTLRLYRDYKPIKLTDEAAAAGREAIATNPANAEKSRMRLLGKPAHPRTAIALRDAAARRKTKAHRLHIGASNHRRWLFIWSTARPSGWADMERQALASIAQAPPPSRQRRWLREEESLLGLAPDSIVAGVLGRSRHSVTNHRNQIGIKPWIPPRDQ